MWSWFTEKTTQIHTEMILPMVKAELGSALISYLKISKRIKITGLQLRISHAYAIRPAVLGWFVNQVSSPPTEDHSKARSSKVVLIPVHHASGRVDNQYAFHEQKFNALGALQSITVNDTPVLGRMPQGMPTAVWNIRNILCTVYPTK